MRGIQQGNFIWYLLALTYDFSSIHARQHDFYAMKFNAIFVHMVSKVSAHITVYLLPLLNIYLLQCDVI